VLNSTNKAPDAKANQSFSFLKFGGGLTHFITVIPHIFYLLRASQTANSPGFLHITISVKKKFFSTQS
jgi:hypothetical protein